MRISSSIDTFWLFLPQRQVTLLQFHRCSLAWFLSVSFVSQHLLSRSFVSSKKTFKVITKWENQDYQQDLRQAHPFLYRNACSSISVCTLNLSQENPYSAKRYLSTLHAHLLSLQTLKVIYLSTVSSLVTSPLSSWLVFIHFDRCLQTGVCSSFLITCKSTYSKDPH